MREVKDSNKKTPSKMQKTSITKRGRKKKIDEVNSDLFVKKESRNRFESSFEESKYNGTMKSLNENSEETKKIRKGKVDKYLIFLIASLIIIGLVMILSSSYYRAIDLYEDGFYFFRKQFIWTILSFIVMFVVMNINYKFFKRFAMLGYYASVVLLIAVYLYGVANKGATRWLEIGPVSFQPSEVAKILLILALARALAIRKIATCKDDVKLKTYGRELLMILVPAALIFVENLSTGIVVFSTGLIMIGISGFKLEKWFCLIGIPAIIVGILFIKVGGIGLISDIAGGKYKSRLERFEVWLDPWEDPTDSGFQVIQSLYAIGSGGIFGVGLGKSKQKLGYIPEAHNDIIFAIICEEFGLIGAGILLLMFILSIKRCINIACHAPDKFSMYFVVGMITLISLQVLINVGVVTNTLPATGMPLPFISYGGTSLLLSMVGMGIILNISKYTNAENSSTDEDERN